MALIPALCPNCGASIEVDPKAETYTCQHCGTSFVTEKIVNNNNYSTVHNVTNNITKVINGQDVDDANDLCSRGLSHLKLENFEEARKCFSEAIRKDPSMGIAYFYYMVAITKNFTFVKGYFDYLIIYNDQDDYYFKLDYIFKLLSEEKRKELTDEYGLNFSKDKEDLIFDVATKLYSKFFDDQFASQQNYLLDDPDELNAKIFNEINKVQRETLSEIVEQTLHNMMEKHLDFSKMFSALSNYYFEYFDVKKFHDDTLKKAKQNNGLLVINNLTRRFFETHGVLEIKDEEIAKLDFRLDALAEDFDKIIVSNNLTDFLLSGPQLPTFKIVEFADDVPVSKVEQFFNFYLLSTNTELVVLPSEIEDKKVTLNLNFRFGKGTDSNQIYTKFKIAKNIKVKIKATVKDRTGIFSYLSKHTSTEKGVYCYSLAIKRGHTKKQKRDLSMLGWFIAGGVALAVLIFFVLKLI